LIQFENINPIHQKYAIFIHLISCLRTLKCTFLESQNEIHFKNLGAIQTMTLKAETVSTNNTRGREGINQSVM
jgi:hypothetical protein